MSGHDVADFEACARHAARWRRNRIATPLVLSETEFQTSLDAFPLEYGEIIRAHQRVYGSDPFDGVAIAQADLRRACETQIKSHLVHLRESYVEAGGRPQAIADLVITSAPAFAVLLRNVGWLNNGRTPLDREAATREGARAASLPEGIVVDILRLEHRAAIPMTDGAKLFPDYLSAVEQLARVVDAWRF